MLTGARPGTSRRTASSAAVVRASGRVALFNLSLAHATLKAGKHSVQAGGIVVTLTKTAASALDSALGTKLFSAGLKLGTATTVLRF